MNKQYRRIKRRKARKSNKYLKSKKQSRKLTRKNSKRSSRNKKLKRRPRSKKQLYGGMKLKVGSRVIRDSDGKVGIIQDIFPPILGHKEGDLMRIKWPDGTTIYSHHLGQDMGESGMKPGTKFNIDGFKGRSTEPEPEPADYPA